MKAPSGFRRRGLLALGLLAFAVPLAGQIRRWNPETLFNSREFSHVTTSRNVSRHVFISSQGPIRPGQPLEGRVIMRDQIRRVLANVNDALLAVGATPNDVVKVHVYVVDYQLMDGISVARQVREYFGDQMPTSSFIPVKRLVWDGARVAMDVVVELPAAGPASR